VEFAESHVLEGLELWKTVLFSDESKYNVFRSGGCNYVWQIPKKGLWGKKKNVCSTIKHSGGSGMVRRYLAESGVGNLHFIKGIMSNTFM
jgi:hypothetical protein